MINDALNPATNAHKKPILLRILFCIITIAAFAYAMFPIQDRDFMTVFKEKINPELTADSRVMLDKIITETEKAVKNDPALYASNVLVETATKHNINLADYISPVPEVNNSKDVASIVKRDCAMAIRKGIDLKGGVEFLIAVEDLPENEGGLANEKLSFAEKADRARELIRTRLEKIGIYEAEITTQAGKFLSVAVPVRSKEEKTQIEKLITQAAKLRFHIVADEPLNTQEINKYLADPEHYSAPDGYMMKTCVETRNRKVTTRYYLVKSEMEMSGIDIKKASVQYDQNHQIAIHFVFNERGAKDFGRVTTANINKQLAVILDGTLYSAPVIRSTIMAEGQIDGNFSREEAENVANALTSGNLPFKMKIEGVNDMDPSLGAENIESGMNAAIASIIAVIIFMAIYYYNSGWIASVALLINVVLILGALAAFQQTLTLPGIAGVILTIGMAVDANILINERIREELAAGKTIFHAIETGYSRAFLTILDSNLTTLLMGAILLTVATGAVKGFAIVLCIGIVTSMFTALVVTRLVFDILARFDRPKSMKMMSLGGIGINPKYCFDYLSRRNWAFVISAIMVLGSLGYLAYRGTDAFSIDFTGGTQISYPFNAEARVSDQAIINVLNDAGFTGTKATYKKSVTQDFFEVIVGNADKSPAIVEKYKGDANFTSPDGTYKVEYAVQQEIAKHYPNFLHKEADGTFRSEVREIGGLVGESFVKSAAMAVLLACAGILVYVTMRFELAYAVASTVALVHDVIVSMGIFLLLGGQLSLTAVAALLTVFGYSLNNTIVIFDRVREQFKLFPDRSFSRIVNDSVNQTLPRSILTTVTVIIPDVILLFWGGIALQDFALIMLIGSIVGGYSSLYLAGAITYVWYKTIGIKHDRDLGDTHERAASADENSMLSAVSSR